jgi:hypothetical protein
VNGYIFITNFQNYQLLFVEFKYNYAKHRMLKNLTVRFSVSSVEKTSAAISMVNAFIIPAGQLKDPVVLAYFMFGWPASPITFVQ